MLWYIISQHLLLKPVGSEEKLSQIEMVPLATVFFLVVCILDVSESCLPMRNEDLIRNTHRRGLIRFNEHGKFKIVNFADLHYGEFPLTVGPAKDEKSTHVIKEILRYENPDFVVFTGDQITGDFMIVEASIYVDMIAQPLVAGGYRWASCYGNHDNGPFVTRESILVAEQKYSLCYTERGPANLVGLTNYYIPVYPPATATTNTTNQDPVLILWFFDSQGGRDGLVVNPPLVDETVVAWFLSESEIIKNRWGALPALAFFHIPTIQYIPIQEEVIARSECTGMVGERVITQKRDSGLMDALADSGTVMSIFVGHDHLNSWCCYYKTLEVCYNRHTGYGGYGNRDRGARIVELDIENITRKATNYIRLEDGRIIDSFPGYKAGLL